jgi:dethiobiotin synthase
MSILVVTGTGTSVGKTIVSAAICALATRRGALVAYVKAAQTGVPGDVPDVQTVTELAGDVDAVEGGRFTPALSPAAAARAMGADPVSLVDVANLVRELQVTHDLVVVEGAGGLLVRFDDQGATIADLARALDAEVLVVTAPGLGTLNHTALTLEVMANRGLRLAGLVIGSWPHVPGPAERANVADLQILAGLPLAGAVPTGARTVDEFRLALAPALGGVFDAREFPA